MLNNELLNFDSQKTKMVSCDLLIRTLKTSGLENIYPANDYVLASMILHRTEESQSMKLTFFFSDSHLAPKFFKVVANSKMFVNRFVNYLHRRKMDKRLTFRTKALRRSECVGDE